MHSGKRSNVSRSDVHIGCLACTQNQYTQIYGPLATGNNYTSPLLHTIKLTGLMPKTKYYYQCAPLLAVLWLTASRAPCVTEFG